MKDMKITLLVFVLVGVLSSFAMEQNDWQAQWIGVSPPCMMLSTTSLKKQIPSNKTELMKSYPMKTKTIKSTLSCLLAPLFAILIGGMASAASDDAETVRDDASVKVAKAWFISLMQGHTAVTASLSEAPFSLDGKREIATMGELKKIYDQVVEKKGKRNLKVASTKVNLSTPEKVTVLITVEGDDKTISVFVKPGDAFRVIGFRD